MFTVSTVLSFLETKDKKIFQIFINFVFKQFKWQIFFLNSRNNTRSTYFRDYA